MQHLSYALKKCKYLHKYKYELRNGNGLNRLTEASASSIGSLTNPSRIVNTFHSNNEKDVSVPTINNYLEYLQDAFIITQAKRYDVKGRRYISTPSKFYFTDLGLRNEKLWFRQYEENHLMENIFYNELLYRGFNVDVGVIEFSDKDEQKIVRK